MPAIETVQIGDIIVEGRDRTEVKKVEVHACSTKGTHINSKYCYNQGTIVQVKRSTTKDSDVEVAGLGDLEDDWNQSLNPNGGILV